MKAVKAQIDKIEKAIGKKLDIKSWVDLLIERELEIELTEPILGTVPKDKEIYKTYIETKQPPEVDEDETVTVTEEQLEGIENKGWTGFHKDEKTGELFIFDYAVKGFFKQAGNTLREAIGIKALRSKLDDYFFIKPRRIYFGKTEPDGQLERPLRVMIPGKGERVTLARSDFINAGTHLTFSFILLPNKDITEKVCWDLLEYGRFQGLGQFRNGSYGRFVVVRKQAILAA